MYDRLNCLIDYEKLTNKDILLVGVGGVGSFCFEVLIRSGIKNITIVDYDVYESSNLNRQLHSNLKTVNEKKVNVLKNYAKNINEDINITIIDTFFDENTNINIKKYDFVIDACDSLNTKAYLCKLCIENNIKFISSMGVGNRVNPQKLKITKLSKTFNDPLAKRFRNLLHKKNIKKDIPVLFSEELPIKKTPIASYIAVTSVAGILIGDYVIKELANEN